MWDKFCSIGVESFEACNRMCYNLVVKLYIWVMLVFEKVHPFS